MSVDRGMIWGHTLGLPGSAIIELSYVKINLCKSLQEQVVSLETRVIQT